LTLTGKIEGTDITQERRKKGDKKAELPEGTY